MKRTSVHIKNMWRKQLCNRKARNFAMALKARKVSGAYEKRAGRKGNIMSPNLCPPDVTTYYNLVSALSSPWSIEISNWLQIRKVFGYFQEN